MVGNPYFFSFPSFVPLAFFFGLGFFRNAAAAACQTLGHMCRKHGEIKGADQALGAGMWSCGKGCNTIVENRERFQKISLQHLTNECQACACSTAAKRVEVVPNTSLTSFSDSLLTCFARSL